VRRTLEVLNELEKESVFSRYAIGGAMAATFYGRASTRAEHLIAICLQTGRAKDRARVAMLREQAQLDREFLAEILKRHQLEETWKLWAKE